MKKKKTVKKKAEPAILFLTMCGDCRIRLVVRKDSTKACDLCKSTNIIVTAWR